MKKIIFIILFGVVILACDDIIEVEDISERTVTVLAPTDESILTITDVNFSWNDVEDSEQYRLQIATPDFETATQIVLDTTIVFTNFTKTLELGNYEWRIRAENSDYQTAYTTQRFSIE
ncbi:MAG: hypothetical protein ACK5M1_04555 [Xanthomarina gelatinilytica]|uniref:hypothetical protein n=1 Tax=Xanthomarina gelatinilytica TaxID=1137281 RepID=UPI003A839DF9